jgi:hypothetical protein
LSGCPSVTDSEVKRCDVLSFWSLAALRVVLTVLSAILCPRFLSCLPCIGHMVHFAGLAADMTAGRNAQAFLTDRRHRPHRYTLPKKLAAYCHMSVRVYTLREPNVY